MHIVLLSNTDTPLWDQAMTLYCQIFPQWEREPIFEIKAAVDAGDSRCVLLCQHDRVIGVSITEVYPLEQFALLGYLYIAPDQQGKGFGKQLCNELFEFFKQQPELKWLLVEAESKPEQFYLKLGFNTFDIDYLSPHYDDDSSSPMALMYITKQQQSIHRAQQLYDIVTHIFSQSYYLSAQDPRLIQQQQNILEKAKR